MSTREDETNVRVERGRVNPRSAAELHSSGIREGFLSSLGIPFLTQLYRAIDLAPQSGVFLAIQDKRVLGFVAYTADIAGCYRWVLTRKGLRLLLPLVSSLFRPRFYRKALETLFYPSHVEKHPNGTSRTGLPRAELLSIAVDSQTRGLGIGKELVDAVDMAMREMRVSTYYVVTDATDERANKFYESGDFHEVRTFFHHRKPMREFRKVLT